MSEQIEEQVEEQLPVSEDSAEVLPDNPIESPSVYIATPAALAEAAGEQVFTISPQLYNYGVVGILFLVVGIALGAFMFSGGGGVSEETVRIAIREELARQLAEIQLNAGPLDLMADDDPFLGPENAPVTIVEFSDFLCQYCGRHYRETLFPLLEEYGDLVKYVYRDFPGVGQQYAVISAMAAECADDQGKFWEYHNILFENAGSLASPNLESMLIGFAEQLNLDMATFTPCLQTQQHRDDVLLDLTDGQGRGMSGTPGFFINGRFLSGAQPIERFRVLIDDELAKLGIDGDDPNTSPSNSSSSSGSS